MTNQSQNQNFKLNFCILSFAIDLTLEIGHLSFYPFLAFGVTQKPIYFPSIILTWASSAGIEPKIIILTGRISHCNTMARLLIKPYWGGRLGKSLVEIIAEKIMPIMAAVIKVRDTTGRLFDKTVALNCWPPIIMGIQPITPIIKALVAQE